MQRWVISLFLSIFPFSSLLAQATYRGDGVVVTFGSNSEEWRRGEYLLISVGQKITYRPQHWASFINVSIAEKPYTRVWNDIYFRGEVAEHTFLTVGPGPHVLTMPFGKHEMKEMLFSRTPPSTVFTGTPQAPSATGELMVPRLNTLNVYVPHVPVSTSSASLVSTQGIVINSPKPPVPCPPNCPPPPSQPVLSQATVDSILLSASLFLTGHTQTGAAASGCAMWAKRGYFSSARRTSIKGPADFDALPIGINFVYDLQWCGPNPTLPNTSIDGCANTTGRIAVRIDPDRAKMAKWVAHEIGHALGLKHETDAAKKMNIMYSTTVDSVQIDRGQCARFEGVPPW